VRLYNNQGKWLPLACNLARAHIVAERMGVKKNKSRRKTAHASHNHDCTRNPTVRIRDWCFPMKGLRCTHGSQATQPCQYERQYREDESKLHAAISMKRIAIARNFFIAFDGHKIIIETLRANIGRHHPSIFTGQQVFPDYQYLECNRICGTVYYLHCQVM